MKVIVAMVIAAGVGAAGFALAQSQNQPAPTGQANILIAQQPVAQPMGTVNLTTSMGPVNAIAAQQHDIRVNTMANDTFVVVKDVTDSQIVFVYRVDQLGKVSLADKKRFYY